MRPSAGLAVALGLFATAGLAAEPPAPQRTIVQRFPISGAPGHEAMLAVIDFPAGVRLGFHTHDGEETGVVQSGLLVIEIAGQPTQRLGPGKSYLIPRGVAHQVSVPDSATRVTATFVVDQGKPLATPVP
jgi:quercetin dioxygenase-like cupin family protein